MSSGAFEPRPLTFEEQVAVEAYREAVKSALSAATDANAALLTACFSLAAAYGALIGLVAPKSEHAPIILALPFLPIAVAIFAALVGRTSGISIEAATTTDEVETRVRGAIGSQRLWSKVSAGALVVALVVGGLIIAATYGKKARQPSRQVTAILSHRGVELVAALCNQRVAALVGSMSASPISAGAVDLRPEVGQPCFGHDLTLPPGIVTSAVSGREPITRSPKTIPKPGDADCVHRCEHDSASDDHVPRFHLTG